MRFDNEDDQMRREPMLRHELDLPAMGRVVRRRKYWVLGPVLLCFIAALIGVNVVAPRYTAEAKILLENQENFFTRPDRGGRETDVLPDDEAVQSQVQLVSSRDIARDAIKVLGLQGNPEFDPLANGLGSVTRLLVLLGLERDPLRVAPEERILSTYYDKLNVYPVVKSRVLSVQFTAQDPDLAAKAANTISDLYINLQSSAKRDSARTAAASLASQIADLKVRAAAAETKAQEYRAQNGLLVGTNNTTITSQQLADITTQLAQSRTAEADSQAKAKLLRDMIKANRISEVPDVANNDLIRRISDQRITLKAQIAQQAQTLLPGHPHMQELNAQLADIDNQMRTAADKIARTLENDARIAASRVENLKTALDAQKQTASTAGADEVTLNNLESQSRLLKDQLEFTTQKYQEAFARENAQSTPADARVISRAVAPATPSFPRKGPMIAIFTLAGLLLSIGVVIGRELLSGRAFIRETSPGAMPVQLAREGRYEDEVEELEARPTPPGAPMATTARSEDDMSPDLAAVLNEIGTRRRDHGGIRTVMAGAAANVPVVPTALRLARALARHNRVILVDCGAGPSDLDGLLARGQTNLADDYTMPGLKDLLAGRTTFAEVIHRDPMSRLHIVPLGTGRSDDQEESFDLVADALGETYDHVIFAVPVPLHGEELVAGERADLAVLIESSDLSREDVDACRAALYAAGVPKVVTLDLDAADQLAATRSAA